MTGETSHAASKLFDGNRVWLANAYETWCQDKLVERVALLRNMLETQTNRSKGSFYLAFYPIGKNYSLVTFS